MTLSMLLALTQLILGLSGIIAATILSINGENETGLAILAATFAMAGGSVTGHTIGRNGNGKPK